MNIVMLTNTYYPHVGGVARSVAAFSQYYRQLDHRVLVVAPEFEGMPANESDVVRIPALQRFNGGDFSVVLPVSGLLSTTLDEFNPDILHAHHPYLLGMTALRIARYRNIPLVFTHHTLYEQYTHYVPGNSPLLQRFAIELATQYANLADRVFAPSESLRDLIRQRGVTTPIQVVPTGVELERYAGGDPLGFRAAMQIPPDAFVVGHVGRLAPEKNLHFLAESVIEFIKSCTPKKPPDAHFLVAGAGPEEATIRALFAAVGLGSRLHVAGILDSRQLTSAYRAMDVFAFSSRSETQGMVLTEAMAAAVPVVALDAPGAREIVVDGDNGRLLSTETPESFAAALRWVAECAPAERQRLRDAALETAREFSMHNCAARALRCYDELLDGAHQGNEEKFENWKNLLRLIKAEWDIIEGVVEGAAAAASASLATQGREDKMR